MIQRTIKEMEPHIKQRFGFALSAFSRMLGVQTATNDVHIRQFCLEWSECGANAPLTGLDEVDQYFYYEYKNWRGR